MYPKAPLLTKYGSLSASDVVLPSCHQGVGVLLNSGAGSLRSVSCYFPNRQTLQSRLTQLTDDVLLNRTIDREANGLHL